MLTFIDGEPLEAGLLFRGSTVYGSEVSRFFVLQYRPGRSNHGRSQKKYRLSIDHGSIFCQLVLFPYINAVYFQSNMS